MTAEQIRATMQAIPTIKDWDAIERMAFYGVRNICPLCGGWKKWGFVCDDCRERYGESGEALVMAEVGRKKVGIDERYLWGWFIGKNLSAIWGKRNGHNQKKAKKNLTPTDDLFIPTERIMEEKVPEEQISEMQISGVQVVEAVVPKAEELALQAVFLAEETDVIEEMDFLPDRQVEIMPGMMIWHNIATAMVCGVTKNRWVCAFCKEPKDDKKWMCGGCYKKFKEQGILALKTYLAKLNHNFNVHPEGSHIPDRKEEVAILTIASKLLSSNFQGHISCHPRELAKTLTTLKGVNEKIPLLILTIIAREALRRKAESNRKELSILVEKKPPVEKPELVGLSMIPLGMKNLKEDKGVARCFLAFLSDAYRRWIVEEKVNGRKPTEGKFAKKVAYNVASWHYLKYPEKYPSKSGISIKKAREISEKLGMSLEDALAIGQALIKEKID